MIRVGIGNDIHKLVPERDLILGGVRIDFHLGLLGHSDADVLIHAVIDALLGACSLGDIGEMFPDSDPAYKNADSQELLKEVLARVSDAKFTIEYIDIIIQAEQPKLGRYKSQIRNNLAELLKLSQQDINIKAKTNEGLDAVGEGKAIAAIAAATVSKHEGT